MRRISAPAGIILCVLLSVVSAALIGPLGEPPHLEIDMAVEPTTIYRFGMGSPDTAEVTLTVVGAGEGEIIHYPVDVMLAIDKSGSMRNGKLEAAKVAAKTFVDELKHDDRSGLVSFGSYAKLEQKLTTDHWRTKSAIDKLTRGGQTAMGDAIVFAQDEIQWHGRNDVTHVMVVLSDGESNQGTDPIDAATAAKSAGTIIYTIGLGDDADEDTLKQVATSIDHYYFSPDKDDLLEIYQEISKDIGNIAGTDVVVTQSLSSAFDFMFFSDPPSFMGEVAVWEVGKLHLEDEWSTTYHVRATACGHQPLIETDQSAVVYKSYDGTEHLMTFDQTTMEVLCAIAVDYAWAPQSPLEGQTVQFTDETDPMGSTIVSWTWDFGDGSPQSNLQNPTHVYADNGDYQVTLVVTLDNGMTGNQTETVVIENSPPTTELNILPVEVDAYLRVAGEKWHDVRVDLYEDGEVIAEGRVTRQPGSPNKQMLHIGHLNVNISSTYSATVFHTPEDDPVNGQPWGANPCWIVLNFSGEEVWIHHTFNVRHSETYVWEVDLTATMHLNALRFEGIARDSGADALTIYWDFGDASGSANQYLNPNGTFPVEIKEVVNHLYLNSGVYTITFTAVDDDGGVGASSIDITIP